MQVYAPTQDYDGEEIEKFYQAFLQKQTKPSCSCVFYRLNIKK